MKPPGMLNRAVLLVGTSLGWICPLDATEVSHGAVKDSEPAKSTIESTVQFQSQPQHPAIIAPHRPQTAYEQEKRADLVVDFLSWDSLRIEKPGQRTADSLSKAELQSHLRAQPIGNTLAVVILSKRKRDAETADSIAAEFHLLGFTRVIIQQAAGHETPEGRPILKDSTASAAGGIFPTDTETNDPSTAPAPKH